jgi:heparanase
MFHPFSAVVTFGLNALQGRHQIRKGVWGGPWNSSNAREFIEYTASKNYPIDSWEFGNANVIKFSSDAPGVGNIVYIFM